MVGEWVGDGLVDDRLFGFGTIACFCNRFLCGAACQPRCSPAIIASRPFLRGGDVLPTAALMTNSTVRVGGGHGSDGAEPR